MDPRFPWLLFLCPMAMRIDGSQNTLVEYRQAFFPMGMDYQFPEAKILTQDLQAHSLKQTLRGILIPTLWN